MHTPYSWSVHDPSKRPAIDNRFDVVVAVSRAVRTNNRHFVRQPGELRKRAAERNAGNRRRDFTGRAAHFRRRFHFGVERFGLTTYDLTKLTINGYISEISGRDQLFASLATVPSKPVMRSSIIARTPDSDAERSLDSEKEDLLDEDLMEVIAFSHMAGR